MELPRRLSVGELAEQLLGDGLIEACELRKDHVILLQDGKRHRFSYRRARAFMVGMLRGRSWTPLVAAEVRRLDAVLDDLAQTAQSMHLIGGLEKMGNGQVRITLSACQTEFSDEEAIAFLADCILHKFKAMEDGQVSEAPEAAMSRAPQPVLPDN